MVWRRDGREPTAADEDALHEGASRAGHSLLSKVFLEALPVPGRILTIDAGSPGLEQLRAALEESAWVLVTVFGPSWTRLVPPEATAPQGQMCQPGRGGKPLHTVLVVAYKGDDLFWVLDPYHTDSLQPFELNDEEMLEVLAGHALVAPRA